jgi:Tfp pilus assembly protein FimV
MKIRHATFALPVALMLQGLVSIAWAQEPSKQPPLEMPKSLIQLDAPAKAAAPEEKPKAVAKKAKPPVVVAEASDKSAKEVAKDSAPLADIGSYKVKPGDTVDRIIQKFYASSLLRMDVLREALVQHNPKSFVKANPKSLIAGSTLSLPNQTELIKKLVPSLAAVEAPAPAPVIEAPSAVSQANVVTPVNVAPVGGAASHQAGHNPGMPDPKRNWVRYP